MWGVKVYLLDGIPQGEYNGNHDRVRSWSYRELREREMTDREKIDHLKSWAMANYENGADTFVECWDDAEYQRTLDSAGGSVRKALKTLRDVAGVYRERQADARIERLAGGGEW